jgi:hypothetical protein
VRGVDSEEADFLTEVDNARIQRERAIKLEERKEVDEVKISFLLPFADFSLSWHSAAAGP